MCGEGLHAPSKQNWPTLHCTCDWLLSWHTLSMFYRLKLMCSYECDCKMIDVVHHLLVFFSPLYNSENFKINAYILMHNITNAQTWQLRQRQLCKPDFNWLIDKSVNRQLNGNYFDDHLSIFFKQKWQKWLFLTSKLWILAVFVRTLWYMLEYKSKWLSFGLVVGQNLPFKGLTLAFLSDTFAPIDPSIQELYLHPVFSALCTRCPFHLCSCLINKYWLT